MEFNTRSLSAQESRVVLALRERGQREVTRADIVKLLGASLKAADKVIGSLRRKGWLERAAWGEYLLIPPEQGPDALGDSNLLALASRVADPYYIGFVTYKGELIQGRHEALITQDLFARVQAILDQRGGNGQRKRRQADGNRADVNLSLESLAQLAEFLREPTVVRQHALRPREHTLSLRRKSHEALSPFHDQNMQALFQLFDAGRQGRLRDIAGGGGTGKVALAGEGHKIFKIADDHCARESPACRPRGPIAAECRMQS